MRHIIETGTDGATLCFFDPAALPLDFDSRMKDDPMEAFDTLAKDGRLWWQSTGSDGGYLFHIYVNEDLPEEIRQYARDPQTTARFLIPSGVVWCSGAEYAASNPELRCAATPRGGLGKYPQMGGKFEIPSGEYSLSVWNMEWPEDYVEEKVRTAIGPGASRREAVLGPICGFLFFGGSISLIALVFSLSRKWWAWMLAAGAVATGLLIGKWLEKSPAGKAKKALELGYPSFAVELRHLADTGLLP